MTTKQRMRLRRQLHAPPEQETASGIVIPPRGTSAWGGDTYPAPDVSVQSQAPDISMEVGLNGMLVLRRRSTPAPTIVDFTQRPANGYVYDPITDRYYAAPDSGADVHDYGSTTPARTPSRFRHPPTSSLTDIANRYELSMREASELFSDLIFYIETHSAMHQGIVGYMWQSLQRGGVAIHRNRRIDNLMSLSSRVVQHVATDTGATLDMDHLFRVARDWYNGMQGYRDR